MAHVAALSACPEVPWQQGLCLFADLKLQRLSGSLLTHTPVLPACSRAAQWRSALMVRAELQDQVVKLDRVAYTSVVRACVDASHWRKALGLQHCRLQVDAPDLNVAISACDKCGDWREALLLFSALSGTVVHTLQQSVPVARHLGNRLCVDGSFGVRLWWMIPRAQCAPCIRRPSLHVDWQANSNTRLHY